MPEPTCAPAAAVASHGGDEADAQASRMAGGCGWLIHRVEDLMLRSMRMARRCAFLMRGRIIDMLSADLPGGDRAVRRGGLPRALPALDRPIPGS